MRREQRSYLLLESSFFRVKMTIEGRLTKRLRRTIALLIFRDISPVLRRIFDTWIVHEESTLQEKVRDESREVSLFQSAQLDDDRGRVGFRIRTRRLEIGFTQKDLARAVGLSVGQLSRIEKGRVDPRPCTALKIERFFDEIEKHLDRAETPLYYQMLKERAGKPQSASQAQVWQRGRRKRKTRGAEALISQLAMGSATATPVNSTASG